MNLPTRWDDSYQNLLFSCSENGSVEQYGTENGSPVQFQVVRCPLGSAGG